MWVNRYELPRRSASGIGAPPEAGLDEAIRTHPDRGTFSAANAFAAVGRSLSCRASSDPLTGRNDHLAQIRPRLRELAAQSSESITGRLRLVDRGQCAGQAERRVLGVGSYAGTIVGVIESDRRLSILPLADPRLGQQKLRVVGTR